MQSEPARVAAIGKLLANKGIPPFLVAANIAEANYESVHLWKENGEIRVETVCLDDETKLSHRYLYRYDSGMVLQSIEQFVAGNHAVIWSRNQEIAQAVKQAVAAARDASVPWQPGAAIGDQPLTELIHK